MVFDMNTHIVALGDKIIYNDVEIFVNETEGFSANPGS